MTQTDFNRKNKIQNNILCIGEILWDMLPEGAKVGGAPLNVAIHLKNFGFNVRFAGKIGNDNLGLDLKTFIEDQGLDSRLLQVDEELPTSTVEVHLEPNNQVRFEIVDNVAWDRIAMTPDLKEAAVESDVIIYGTLASRHEFTRQTILDILKSTAGLKLIDVNLRAPFNTREVVETMIEGAGIAKLNDDELRVIGGWYNKSYNERELTEWFAEKYNTNIVCVTRGANGALIYKEGKYLEHPGFKVEVKDTVGSGDAFLAGFLANYLAGEELNKSLEYACATGALVATKAGGTPDYRISEITDIIRSYK